MIDMGWEPASADEINVFFGEPLELFCGELLGEFSESLYSKFYDGIQYHQKHTLAESGVLYPGIREMMENAIALGYELAVCSNSEIAYINLVTSCLEIDNLFSYFSGIDEYSTPSKTQRVKELIEKTGSRHTFMIGDRYHDIEAGVENNIHTIGCTWGYGTSEELKNAEFIVNTPVEITELISDCH